MHVAQDRDQWWALVNMVMKGGEFVDQLSERLKDCCMELTLVSWCSPV